MEDPATELTAEDAEPVLAEDAAVGAGLFEEVIAPIANTGVGAALVPELPATGPVEKVKSEVGTLVDVELLLIVCGGRERRGAGDFPEIEFPAVAEGLPADGPELAGVAGGPAGCSTFLTGVSFVALPAWLAVAVRWD